MDCIEQLIYNLENELDLREAFERIVLPTMTHEEARRLLCDLISASGVARFSYPDKNPDRMSG